MFRKIKNYGLVCVLHADNDTPLKLWDKRLRDGKLKRIAETEAKGTEMKGLVLEFTGKVPFSNYITCPRSATEFLGIRYPYMIMTVKADEEKFFALDVQVIDETGTRRKFRFATSQVSFDVQPFHCRIPLVLEEGWNSVVVPLHELTREVYATRYVETLRLQIYPSCRIKKLFFGDKNYSDDDLPEEFHHHSVFTDTFTRKRYSDSKTIVTSLGSKTIEVTRLKDLNEANGKKQAKNWKHEAQEVIPRVIPVNYGSPAGNKTTYSSL